MRGNRSKAFLAVGDLAALTLFATAGSLSPPPGAPAEVAAAVGQNLVLLWPAWLIAGAWLRAFELRLGLGAFLLRTLAGGLLAMLVMLTGRGLLLGWVPPLSSLLLLASDGVVYLLAWRLPVRLVYGIVQRLGWARLRALALGGFVFAALAAAALLAPRVYAVARYGRQVYPAATVPARPLGVVFGAALWPDGRPSSVLENRVATAAALYHAGKVQAILLTGDGRSVYYDEPGAMRRLALALGVPEEALVMDYAGLSTYDSCYRAKAVYGAGSVILVTQGFQLVRALFICEALGLQPVGVAADREVSALRSMIGWNTREVLATAAAWWDVYVARPVPTLGQPVPAAD